MATKRETKPADEYSKLFKKLGRSNGNKDVRIKMADYLNEYMEN